MTESRGKVVGMKRKSPAVTRATQLRDMLAAHESDECLEWPYSTASTGYGDLRFDGRTETAHRVAFFITNGRWPQECRHTCDNRPCFNPRHLLDGTRSDNMRDMVERGRHPRLSHAGEECGKSKLNWEAVKCIRWLASHGYAQNRIARAYKISPSTVAFVVRGDTWKNPPERNPQ